MCCCRNFHELGGCQQTPTLVGLAFVASATCILYASSRKYVVFATQSVHESSSQNSVRQWIQISEDALASSIFQSRVPRPPAKTRSS